MALHTTNDAVVAPPGWEYEHFTLQAVDSYPEYENVRKRCTDWSTPTSLLNHTLRNLRARYPFELNEASLASHSRRFFAGCNPHWNLQVQTCTLRTEDTSPDVQRTWTFTRVGPVILGPGAYLCIALIPEMPAGSATTFVVSATDSYTVDARDGRGYSSTISYPPVHPHHSNSFNVGYHPSLTQLGGPGSGSPFELFYPWAAYSTHQLDQFGAQASMNSPGFNADFVGCRPGASLAACSYLQVPDGHGYPVYKGTDLWSTSLVNRVGTWNEPAGSPPMQVIFEYGRQFITAAPSSKVRPASILTPVWTLDFAVVGNGNTYEIGRIGNLESVMFHTYTMPVGGRFLGSWFHTHAQASTQMWVLAGDYSQLLPKSIVASCHARNICRATGPRAYGTTGPVSLPIFDTGYSIKSLQAHVRDAAAPTNGLRCEYRSMAKPVDGGMWGRQSVRSISSRRTCDGWAFAAGQSITLLAFNHMHLGVTQQHIRWFPVAELSIPIPAAALAGFRGERRAGGGNGSVVEAGIAATSGRPEEDSIDDWMEFMGR